MKKIFLPIIILITLFFNINNVLASTFVKGYLNKNGNYIESHFRSDKDYTKLNNWSTYGNINPYTGEIGTKKYDDYNNYGGKIQLPVVDYSFALEKIKENIKYEIELKKIEEEVRNRMGNGNNSNAEAQIAWEQNEILNKYNFFNIEKEVYNLADKQAIKVRYENILENQKEILRLLPLLKNIEQEVRNRMGGSHENRIQAEISWRVESILKKINFYEKKISSNFVYIPLEEPEAIKEIYTKSNYNIYDLERGYCNSEEKIENEIKEEVKKFFYVYENYINGRNISQGEIMPVDGIYNLEKFEKTLDYTINNYFNSLKGFFKGEVTQKELDNSYLRYKRGFLALSLINLDREKIKTNLLKMCEKVENNKKQEKLKSENIETKKETKTTNKNERVDKILDDYNKKYPGKLKKLVPALENLLKKETKTEKIELIKYIIEKIKKY